MRGVASPRDFGGAESVAQRGGINGLGQRTMQETTVAQLPEGILQARQPIRGPIKQLGGVADPAEQAPPAVHLIGVGRVDAQRL